jgi:hypothetical protein
VRAPKISKSFARFIAVRALMALLLFMTLAAWSMGSAVGSSPDEDYVLTSIWCANTPKLKGIDDPARNAPTTATGRPIFAKGETCRRDLARPGTVWVPSKVAESNCSLGSDTVGASCQKTLTDDIISTNRVNSDLYPNTYLNALHSLVSQDVYKSTIYMRLLNSLISAVLIVFTLSLNKKVSIDLAVALLSIIVPVGISLISSVNTSSWAVTGSAIFTLSLIAIDRRSLKSKHTIICIFSSALGFWIANASRHETKYQFLLILIFVLLYKYLDYLFLLQVRKKLIVVVFFLIGAVFFLLILQDNLLFEADFFDNQQKDKIALLTLNFLNLPLFITGFFGSWGLNSFDALLMQTVWLFATASFSLVICQSLRYSQTQNKVIGFTSIAVFCATILFYLQYFFVEIRDIVQPRYFFPLLIGSSLLIVGNKKSEFSRSLIISIGFLATAANAIALRTVIRRYVTGQNVKLSKSLNSPRDWWWTDKDSGTTLWVPAPETVWLIGSLAFAMLFALIIYERNLESAETSKT